MTTEFRFPTNEGVCPRCREVKFIGHGPLCTECYTGKTIAELDAEDDQ